MKKVTILCMISMLFLVSLIPVMANEEMQYNGFNDIEDGKSREVYGNLYRNAIYRIMNDQGGIYTATARQGNYFYINGKWENCAGQTIRELINVKGQTLKLAKKTTLFQEPFTEGYFEIGSVPAGTYPIEAQSLDLYKITIGNKKGWIQADPGCSMIVGTNKTLGKSSIEGIPVHELIAPIGDSIRPGIGMKPQYITIHNTANTGAGANAKSHAYYLYNGESRKDYTSWHFTVDNKEIWQSLPMNESGYHAGDGFGMGNTATIAIEICENADGNYRQAEENAAVLTAYLLSANDLPADAVRYHRDWSGKHCPHNMFDGTKNSMGQSAFQKRVKEVYDSIHFAKTISFQSKYYSVKVNETVSTKLTGNPSSAKLGDISYQIGNEAIASVDANGKVQGKAVGNTYLYAKSEKGANTRIAIKVEPANVEKMYFSASNVTTVVGQTFTNALQIYPKEAQGRSIVYSNSNANVIKINDDQTFSAIGFGTAVISARTSDGKLARTTILVKPASYASVYFPILIKEMNIGQIRNVSANTTPAGMNITYRTGNRNIARVDAKGNVSAVGVGNTYLYALLENGKESKIPIKVNAIEPSKISFDENVIRIHKDDIYASKLILYPTYATKDKISYRTGNSSIASVDKDGIVYAYQKGNTYLYATSENGVTTRIAVDIK